MTALPLLTSAMACPRCAEPVTVEARTLRCSGGHAFDLAKQGYVNLLTRPAGAAADDAAMVEARSRIVDGGLYSPIADALAQVAASQDLPEGIVVDVGAGTGHYTATVLDALSDRLGLATDLSVYAARRAAKAHPRLASVVADVRDPFPVRTGAAALVLDVFAPRNPAEFARVLAPGGMVVVVTPTDEHLRELVDHLGMPRVDPRKAERLAEAFAGFRTGPVERVSRSVEIPGPIAASLVRMGPAAHHVAAEELARLEAQTKAITVTVSVEVSAFTA